MSETTNNITLLNPKGEFNNNLFYAKGDTVYMGYSIYTSLVQDNNAELSDTESWAMLLDGSKIGTAIAEVNDLNNNAGYKALVNKVNTLLAEYAKNEQSYTDTFNKNEQARQTDWYNQLTTDEEQYQKKYQDILDQYNSWLGIANKNANDRQAEYNDLKSAMEVLQINIVNLNDRATKNLQDAETATAKANAAQALAEGAVNNANTAATNANTAADRALAASNSVEESKNAANQAAANCNEAIKLATEAKAVCMSAANDATKAKDEAQTAAQAANAAANSASNAKEEAATATLNAQGATESAKKAANDASTAASDANNAASAARLAATDVTKAIDNAELAKTEAEAAAKAATDAANDTVSAKNTALEVANHPTYVGEDYFVYKYNLATKSYERTNIYVKGAAFKYSDFTADQLVALQGKPAKLDASSSDPNAKTWWTWDNTANGGKGGYVDTGISPAAVSKAIIENYLTGNITTHTHDQYLTKTDASATYATKTDVANNYLTKNDATTNYISKTEATKTFITKEEAADNTALASEITRAKGAEKTNADNIAANKTSIASLQAAINVLNGDKNTAGSVKKAIADLVAGAPEAYDTLKEIADYIADDKNAATAITNQLATKITFVEV